LAGHRTRLARRNYTVPNGVPEAPGEAGWALRRRSAGHRTPPPTGRAAV